MKTHATHCFVFTHRPVGCKPRTNSPSASSFPRLLHSVFLLPLLSVPPCFLSSSALLPPSSHLQVLFSTAATARFMSARPPLPSSCLTSLYDLNILSSQPHPPLLVCISLTHLTLFLDVSFKTSFSFYCLFFQPQLVILYNPSQCIPLYKKTTSKPVLVFLLTDRSLSTGFKEAEMAADVGTPQSNLCVFTLHHFSFNLTFLFFFAQVMRRDLPSYGGRSRACR